MQQVYPEDDAKTAAKKAAQDLKREGYFIIPEGKGDKPTPHFIQKYSDGNHHLLAESILIGNEARFAVSELVNSKTLIHLEKSISLTDKREYRPYEKEAYLSRPYTFKSKEDFELCVEKARKETLDTLYEKVKTIWKKYIDADDFHISICAADTIFTYYQDKIGMTHYLFFVGNNGSGKSNNLLVLKFLAYRNFTSTDMTAANIYQFLGSDEEGQGTLCEDEADRIEVDRMKMAIHKNGYIAGIPVPRTDTSNGRKQLKLNTYCFKAFGAEKFPDALKAKGFNQRVIELQCSYGDPEQDIAEVANPAGEEEYQQLLDELEETRNILLICRLLHFNEKIRNIKLNIKGREKQLFKPVLRIFQKAETLKELLPVVSNYVSQKRESNYSTTNAFLYRFVIDIIRAQNTLQLESGVVYNYIKAGLNGEDIPGKTLSFETPEFGVMSQKEITQTLFHIFGAKIKRTGGKRMLVFDPNKLDRLGKVYNADIEIKVLEEKPVSDVSDMTNIESNKDKKSSTKDKELSMNNECESIFEDPTHPSQAAHPSLCEEDKQARLREYERCNKESLKRSKLASKGELEI